MTPEDVQALVAREIADWRLPQIAPGSTRGVLWDEERYRAQIDLLRTALVVPRQQRFVLEEEQVTTDKVHEAIYWVVAVTGSTLVWFDEARGEFGLASAGGPNLPMSIGVRGDLVGVFCAR